MQWVDQLIDYLSAFDSRFGSFVASAAAEDIETIRRHVGRALPAELEQFWARMGGEYGGVFNHAAISAFADEIAAAYEERTRGGHALLPDDCVLFAVGTMTFDALAVCTPSGQVVHIEGSRVVSTLSRNLPAFVFQEAFHVYDLDRLEHRRTWSLLPAERDGAVQRFGGVMEAAGLAPREFTDAWNWCGGMDGTRAMACVRGPTGGWLAITGACAGEVDALASEVSRSLGRR